MEKAGFYTAHSSDGFNWSLDSAEPTWPGGDVITSIYHPAQRRGIAAMKRIRHARHIRRRCIAQAQLREGVWSAQHLALIPDEYDDICAQSRGFATGDYYGMGMMPAGQGTVGFMWQFRHHPPYRPAHSSGLFGAIDITLAFQAKEGERWMHAPGRTDFLRHGSHDWNPGGGCTASAPVMAGSETRLYFSGSLYGHSWQTDVDFEPNEKWRAQMNERGPHRCIACAKWPNHRLFGFRAAPEGILSLDLGHIAEPSELYINYKTEVGGCVRVELVGQKDLGLDDAVAMESDHIAAAATWKSGTIIQPPAGGMRLAVRVHLDRASVYAYEVRPVSKES